MRLVAGMAVRQFKGLLLLAPLLLGTACVSDYAVPSGASEESARRHADSILEQARAELGGMREALAASRIAVAKKDAELQELWQQLAEVKRAADTKQGEAMALRRERDQLFQAKNEYRVKLEEVPELRQKAAEAAAREAILTTKIHDLESTVTALQQGMAATQEGTRAMETRLKNLEGRMSTIFAAWQHLKAE